MDIINDPDPAVTDREFDITRDGTRLVERIGVPSLSPASAGRHVYQFVWGQDGNLVIRTRQRTGALLAHSVTFVIDQ